jgi:hypothetical protein
MTMRRVVASIAESVIYIGAALAFFVVLGLMITLGYAILSGVVVALGLEPKGGAGILIQILIPTGVGFWVGERLVIRRLGSLFDRLERWKTQGQ